MYLIQNLQKVLKNNLPSAATQYFKQSSNSPTTLTEHNLELPEWSHAVFPEPLTRLRGLLFKMEVEDPTITKLAIGPLFNVIASDMLNIAKLKNTLPKNIYTRNPSETRPLHLFAAHDTTVTMMMRALKIYDNVAPAYGAALGIELRSKNDKDYYVTVVYEHSLSAPLRTMNLPGCQGVCSLTDFLSIVTPLIPDNWDADCKKDDMVSPETKTTISEESSTVWTLPTKPLDTVTPKPQN